MPLQTRSCSQDVDGEYEHSVDFLDPNGYFSWWEDSDLSVCCPIKTKNMNERKLYLVSLQRFLIYVIESKCSFYLF